MPIRVEFYGIARQRAGRPAIELEPSGSATLGAIIEELGQRLPEFGRACVAGGDLQPELAANLDGQRFISDPATSIRDGQCLLILSADAGG
jgi:sulfur-carrier protein